MVVSEGSTEPRGKRQSSRKILLSILFLVLILGLVLGYIFNVGGMKDHTKLAVTVIANKVGSDAEEQDAQIDKILEQVQLEREKISYFENELLNKEAEIDSRQRELEDKEIQLRSRQEEIDKLEERLSQKIEDIRTISKYYEQMDAERAAMILTQMEDTGMIVVILKNMKKDSAAQILENIEPQRAADITNTMLGE